jgi:two-component system, sensor histidine kinase
MKTAVTGEPPSFADLSVERGFLHEYRLAGLRSVTYACALGIAAYLAIGVVDIALGGWDPEATLRRLIAVALLMVTATVIVAEPYRVLRNYSLLLGTLGTITIVGLISVIHLLRDEDVRALVNPVALLALWILYGFVRLPIRVAVLVGTVASLFSMFGCRLTNMEEPGARTLIYLIMGNALGVLLARSIEKRERQLFLQRRIAEAAQTELLRRTNRAETASAEKSRLMAAVGHDLRQPMLSAALHAGVLSQKLEAGDLEAVGKQAERVEQSVKVLGDTLEHLLTAAQYDADGGPTRVQPIPLSRVFERLRELFQPEAQRRGLSLRIKDPGDGLLVYTDEQTLFRTLMNLVSNAMKFTTPAHGAEAGVVVRAFFRGDACRVFVADNGIGIPETEIESIWEPYFQVGNQERSREKGLGLGLYLVKESLKRLPGHTVSARSTFGRGSRFCVGLPAVRLNDEDRGFKADLKAGSVHPEALTAGDLSGQYILLIEDDQEVRAALESQFAAWGMVCTSASNAQEVMQLWRAEGARVDRIVADFRLPGGTNGADAINEIRHLLGYHPSAILITAEVDRSLILSILPPQTSFLKKPFDATALMSALLN